jgi:RNA polymerase sigma-70 factor (ECF subfamily)
MSSILLSELVNGSGVGGDERAARAAASRAEALGDAKLVEEFNDGDENAFNEIVRRHRGRIFSVVSGCLRDPADVEEVVDDTFIRAYRGLATFRGESPLATWLHRIAINLARNRYWFLFRRGHLAFSLDEPVSAETNASLVDFVPSKTRDPAQEMDQEEFAKVVAACLDRLPQRQREILKLRTALDSSYADIATEIGINVGTVKSRIARARHHLRAEVEAIAPETLLRSRQSFGGGGDLAIPSWRSNSKTTTRR